MRDAIRAAAFAVLAAGPAQANPPVEAFGNLPQISNPRLSPDGRHIVVMQQIDGRPAEVIYQTNAPPGAQPAVLSLKQAVITGAAWVSNDRLLVTLKANIGIGITRYHTISRGVFVDLAGTSGVLAFRDNEYLRANSSGNAVIERNLDDPHVLYVELFHLRQRVFFLDLYKVDAYTGKTEDIAYGDINTVGWYMDGHGHITGRLEVTRDPLTYHLMVPDGDNWHEITSFDARAGGDGFVAGLGKGGKSLIVSRRIGGRTALYPIDIKTGVQGPALFSDPRYDADDVIEDPSDDSVIGVGYAADKVEYHYFDPKWDALQKGLEAAFPGQSVIGYSADATLDHVIVRTDSPGKGVHYYYLDRTTHAATEIGAAWPGLSEADLGVMKSFSYKARDGLEIPAYMTMPPGKSDAKGLPLVVYVHGGPEARDVLGFDWWGQFMANRGYAVFQPEFRGSSGYGYDFMAKGFHQMGHAMQDDVTDGVMKLIADGTVDPKRICIVGASYGGYAALAGAAFTPGLYRCAVSVSGVTDVRQMLEDDERYRSEESWTKSYFDSRIGDPSKDADDLNAVSPALHADRIEIPVLLIHGQRDSTVSIAQSLEMRDALEALHKPVTFIQIDADDHYMSVSSTRIRMLTELENFLKANIGK